MSRGELHSLPANHQSRPGRDAEARTGCEIWGVLNVTPDSFSDGGLFFDPDAALGHAAEMSAQGADVIDVGGESSRPAGGVYGAGAGPVSEAEEVRRVEPVIGALSESGVRVSIDTVKAGVARRAVAAGAVIVNDVSCGTHRELLEVAADTGVELVLMHNRGRGGVTGDNVRYRDVVGEVVEELTGAVRRAIAVGVARDRIWIDPGIGFAKTAEQSIELLARLDRLVAAGFPVLVGPSRKSFVAAAAPGPDGRKPAPGEREWGTAAAVTAAVLGGARAVRVHDVRAMRQAVLVAESIAFVRSPGGVRYDPSTGAA
jgi:dihydropteroate synthase